MRRSLLLPLAVVGLAVAACEQVPSAVPGPRALLSATAAAGPVITTAVYVDSTYTVRVEYSDTPPRGCCFREAALWRREVGGVSFVKIAESRTIGVVIEQRFDVKLEQDFEYKVEVVGYGVSRFSGVSLVHTGIMPAPGGLTWVVEDGSSLLRWSDNSVREQEFLVQKWYTDRWAVIARAGRDVNEVPIDPPQSSGRYRVLARAQSPTSVNHDLVLRTSAPSPELLLNPLPAAAPSIVSGAFTLDDYGVHLSFTYAAADSVGFVLDRRPAGSAAWERVPVAAASGGFVDRGFPVDATGTFQYRVRACNRIGCRASDSVQVATPELAAPSAFNAARAGSGVALAWQDNSAGEQSFLIQRRTPSTPFRNVVTTGPGRTSFVDPAPVVGEENIYRVYAWVGGDTKGRTSDPAGGVSVVIPLPPPTVTQGYFSYPDYGVHVSFSYGGPAGSTFRLERRLVNAPAWEVAAHAVRSGNAFTDQSFRVSAQNDFEYRVSACMAGRCTGSAPVRVNTPRLHAVTNVAAVLASGGVRLTWTDTSTGEDAFMIQRATSPTGPWSILQVVLAGSTSFMDPTPVRGQTNHYRVRPRATGVPEPRWGTTSEVASVPVP